MQNSWPAHSTHRPRPEHAPPPRAHGDSHTTDGGGGDAGVGVGVGGVFGGGGGVPAPPQALHDLRQLSRMYRGLASHSPYCAHRWHSATASSHGADAAAAAGSSASESYAAESRRHAASTSPSWTWRVQYVSPRAYRAPSAVSVDAE